MHISDNLNLEKIGELPQSSRLDMPVQDLSNFGVPPLPRSFSIQILIRRIAITAMTFFLGVYASNEIYERLRENGLNGYEYAVIAIFFPLFSLIAFGFISTSVGFFRCVFDLGAQLNMKIKEEDAKLVNRYALLMPICNENVQDTFGRIIRIVSSLSILDCHSSFDFFVLSDSSQEFSDREYLEWKNLLGLHRVNIFYRRRPSNDARKSGNIADWLQQFGGAYEAMIIFDADSYMSGEAIAKLASMMEEQPGVGVIQTVPRIFGAKTLFQRWLRFCSDAYTPMTAAGLQWWSASNACYWGHNAIVRTKAFASSCGLPELTGKPPFGGLIQSHDTVEAALLGRQGWSVKLAIIDGSYEEAPPTVLDYAIRDRRWMHGNLQHLRLLGASGFRFVNRAHLFLGACVYLASLGWLLMLMISVLRVAAAPIGMANGILPENVLILTVTMLLAPKAMGLAWVLVDRDHCSRLGGARRALISFVADTVLSALFAPVTMVMHSQAFLGFLSGRPTGWSSQNRKAQHRRLQDVMMVLRDHFLLGVIFASTAALDRWLFIWLLPVTVPLIASPILVQLTAKEAIFRRLFAEELQF